MPNDLQAEILAEVRSLRAEIHDLRSSINGTGKEPGMGEQIRELRAEVQRLRAEVVDLEGRTHALEAAPGAKSLQRTEAVALAIVIAASVGLGGLLWSEIHPAPPAGAAPTRSTP